MSPHPRFHPTQTKTYEQTKKHSQTHPKQTTPHTKLLYIYHTHTSQSYFPLLPIPREANQNKP
ncbi:stage II sporulation protein P, partial [Priestia megaterium]|uniref:stage II sporulation protein P n=1 Tax=Priestia megaterium TaxID=1404 RepID=UPI0021BFDD94